MPHSPFTPSTPAARTVICPACGGPSLYSPSNAYRPFCGERCKNHDLGAWANEDFRLPTTARENDDADEVLQNSSQRLQ